ncbi:M48 family metalloprotease [Nakamurella aerolata]|nr:M48 family metalloprotease [Nakamurella aerolata]
MDLMLVAALAAALGSVLLGRGSTRLVRALPPRLAVPAMTLAAVLLAACTVGTLLLVAAGYALGWGPIAAFGGIRPDQLHARLPIPGALAAAAGAAAVLLLLRLGFRAVHLTVAAVRSARYCRRLPGRARLVFVPGDDAVAVSGRPGRVMVGRGLYRRLDPVQRRALIAHERSHLVRRHHAYLQATELAIALNPLLTPVGAAVRFAVERWADEDAVQRIGDRTEVAMAIATAAVRAARPAPAGAAGAALAAARSHTVGRVQVLLADPTPSRPLGPVAAALALALVLLLTATGALDLHHAVEAAQPAAH